MGRDVAHSPWPSLRSGRATPGTGASAGAFQSGFSYLECLVGLRSSVECLHVLSIQPEGFCAVPHCFLVLLQGQMAERSDGKGRWRSQPLLSTPTPSREVVRGVILELSNGALSRWLHSFLTLGGEAGPSPQREPAGAVRGGMGVGRRPLGARLRHSAS